jgi:hypothetical protein
MRVDEEQNPSTGSAPQINQSRGQVGQGAAAVVVVLDPHGAGLARGEGGVAAAAGLDRGLLISADHVVVVAERPTVPGPGVQVPHPGGLGRKLRIADGDPGPVLPRLERVASQPPADRGC